MIVLFLLVLMCVLPIIGIKYLATFQKEEKKILYITIITFSLLLALIMWCTRISSIIISPFINTYIFPLANSVNNMYIINILGNLIFILANILIAVNITIINFIPTIIAYKKDKKKKTSILLWNAFLGWAFIGWVVCLVWSLSNTKTEVQTTSNKYEDLEKLQELKENGAITEVEFEIEKQKLLR